MTSSADLLPLGDCDDPAAVLSFARGRKSSADDADRDVLRAAAKFASMHASASRVAPIDEWHERGLPMGGQGCPEVTEFCVAEFAAALGRSTESGRRYLSHAVEAFYRLPACWARLDVGHLQAWKLCFIAERTLCLSPAAAAFVDHHVAPVAHKIGPAQLDRLIAEAKARFDPETTEAERLAAAESRKVDIDLANVGVDGVARVDAALDLADALDLETAVADLAHQLLLAGCRESLDIRRSLALGLLARGDHALDLGPDTPPPTRRQIVLHAHIAAEAVRGAAGAGGAVDLARVHEVLQAITAEQVRQWCGNPDTSVTVKPVIDLADHIHVMSYEASERLRDQTDLRDVTCAHPWCHRPAMKCDHEHRVPYDPVNPERGPTCSCNQAPMCRRHHRLKTTGGWTYVTIEPGVYLWRSPLGYHYLRDHTGTIDVTPGDDRRRYARELVAHFGDQPPDR